MRIPITRPAIDEAEIEAVTRVLRSGMLVQGQEVLRFEERIAAEAGTRHAVALSNCTVALEVALRAMGVGPGDAVVVTPYSWVATVNAIEIVGATPIFADIDPHTFNLSAEALAVLLAGRSDVKAILPVHTFGNLAGIESVVSVASDAGVAVLEDAACAIGAKSGVGNAGGIGIAGCFSFHPRKVVTTGEGGAITTNDDAIADYARCYRNHGQANGGFAAIGSNLRMTDFQAAMGSAQMDKLATIVAERQQLAERYDEAIVGLGFEPQRRAPGSVVQSYVALAPSPRTGLDVVTALRARDIEATVGTIAIPFTAFHRTRYGRTEAELPALVDVDRRGVTLPLFPGMTADQQADVVAALAEIVAAG